MCGEPGPGADGEAVVAAVDSVADGFAELVRDGPLMLDRKIGNAAARIELEGGGEGPGGAGGKAARTASATLGVGRVGLQLQGRVDGAQEQPAAVGDRKSTRLNSSH